ncbi:hypothetical protein [Actinokineospora terrae]|uniref:Allene oxide cyclase barrel-like domain-containing protein n=1 Tax=Actinokineospora terrae TaxID=155974 RepID=A0A1H9X0Y4_9PSEU|nr:hypothetical protein [Actinokineospora terrae]SES39739.1 hypothetical protein SAMN04487818_112106 [Actinokineospora terrae]
MGRVVALAVLLLVGSSGTAWADSSQVAVPQTAVSQNAVSESAVSQAGLSQTISVQVVDGDLLLSVERGPVALPEPHFAGSWYTTAGTLPGLTVVDTRAADPGWSLSGQFDDESGGTPLSWTPAVVDQSAVQVLTLGKSTIGMRGSGLLAAADPAAGRGTARLTAGYRLLLPAAAGYEATLTLTVI